MQWGHSGDGGPRAREESQAEAPGPWQPLREQVGTIFSGKRVMTHLSRTCPPQVLQQLLLNIGSNGQRQNSCLGGNNPHVYFPSHSSVPPHQAGRCVSHPRVTVLASHIPPTIPHKPRLQGWIGKPPRIEPLSSFPFQSPLDKSWR